MWPRWEQRGEPEGSFEFGVLHQRRLPAASPGTSAVHLETHGCKTARRRRGGLRSLAPAGPRAEAEGGLHDDAGRPAFGDLLHRFSIMGTLHCIHDLRQKTKKRMTVIITVFFAVTGIISDRLLPYSGLSQKVTKSFYAHGSGAAPKPHLSVFLCAGCTQMPPFRPNLRKFDSKHSKWRARHRLTVWQRIFVLRLRHKTTHLDNKNSNHSASIHF